MQVDMTANSEGDIEAKAAPAPIGAEALYRAYGPFIASFLRHMGVPEAELDDLVQDVFVLAHRKGGYLPGPAAPRTWLGSLAIRVVVARRRALSRRPHLSNLVEGVPDAMTSPEETLDTQRSLERVQTALDTLSMEHRATFVLYEIEGESCQSIAAMLGVPVGTIYSRLFTARKRFLNAYRRCALRAGQQPKDEP